MDDRHAFLERAQALLDEEQDLESALRYLRTSGFNIIDSIKATMELTGASLGEAKRIVHTSEAWSDRRAEHDAFHRRVAEAAEALTDDEVAVAHRRGGRG